MFTASGSSVNADAPLHVYVSTFCINSIAKQSTATLTGSGPGAV